ncbi:MAG: hypothetical protein ABR929_02710 [Roseiarcus sp.]|jgi:hypothetical protein
MPPAVAPARARKAAPARRGSKILVALVADEGVDAVAERERHSRRIVSTRPRERRLAKHNPMAARMIAARKSET